MNIHKTIIIGAGQAGLAMGYHLQLQKEPFLIIDSHSEIGDSWRKRYDSLQLFTPRSHSSLPGLKMQGEQSGYPTKDELAKYLKAYQTHFNLPVSLENTVKQVTKSEGKFVISTEEQEFICSNLIIATGPFQVPYTPPFQSKLSSSIHQVHTDHYKNPSSLKSGDVLIVGGGNSGMQIAVELVNDNRKVYLSLGKKPKFFPYEVLGKSIFWWLSVFGIMNFTINSRIGQKIKENDPIIGKEIKPYLKEGTIEKLGRTIDIQNDHILFEGGKSLTPSNVIWATGYKNNYSWIKPSSNNVFDAKGYPIHNRGVTKENGLYFIGLSWQYRRGSALLLGVGRDAEFLAKQISGGKSIE